jgi:hypothetical protein
MPDAPDPVTSPPNVPGQPYDATASGSGDAQSAPTTVYNATGGPGSSDPWPKVQDGGAADWRTGKVTGRWPADGTSDGSAWSQC